jgi:hypothetical protein
MALFTPSASPAVVVKEIDLTGGVPNVQTSTGAIVGNFRWGPVGERVLVANEAGLIQTFGAPNLTASTAQDFHNASYFLRYSNSLYVVREATDEALNAQTHKTGVDPVAKAVNNKPAFDITTFDSGQTFIAKYPGDLGNSLRVSICPPDSAGGSSFADWIYKSSFDGAPSTSSYDSARNGISTEVHIAIVDKNGEFTGTKGTVLEAFPYVSLAGNSKNADGTTNYVKDVINTRSQYVYLTNFDSAFDAKNAGDNLTPGTNKNYAVSGVPITNYDFADGFYSYTLTASEYATGFDLFEDKDAVEIDFLIAPSLVATSAQTTVVNDLASIATARKDCVVVTSPARNDVIGINNETTITNNLVTTAGNFTKSSYLIMDGNFLKVYDKFNDQYLEIPAASSTAGLMAETDRNAAPWFSPAGVKRGQYLGVTGITYNPNKTNRDTLYKAGVNPIVNIQGSGVILFGDKTLLNRPSAFDRINVRRLFLVLERAIARAAEGVMFEFNDEFTRAEFVNIIEPVLRDVKGRRGITDFRIVADETVNTPEVIDRNEFIANIFIKPARSINYVTLNFVAVRSGVDFEEVVGTV